MTFDPNIVETLQNDLRTALEGKFGFTRMAEEYRSMILHSGETALVVDWKTSRGWHSEDDTTAPITGFEEIVREIADRHGLVYRKWEPVEKGWGDFYFVSVDDVGAPQEPEDEYSDGMDGDHQSALESVYGPDDDDYNVSDHWSMYDD